MRSSTAKSWRRMLFSKDVVCMVCLRRIYGVEYLRSWSFLVDIRVCTTVCKSIRVKCNSERFIEVSLSLKKTLKSFETLDEKYN